MNETSQHEHLEILESQRYRLAVKLKAVNDRINEDRQKQVHAQIHGAGAGVVLNEKQEATRSAELKLLVTDKHELEYTITVLEAAIAELRELDAPYTILFLTIDKELVIQVVL